MLFQPGDTRAELEQEEIATKRKQRVDKRIADLQAKKKELQAAAKPATKSKSKKEKE